MYFSRFPTMDRVCALRRMGIKNSFRKYNHGRRWLMMTTNATERIRYTGADSHNLLSKQVAFYRGQTRAASSGGKYPAHKIAKLPSLSPTMEHGTLTIWEKEEGDILEEGDNLCQVETDKAVMPMETPYAGYLAKKLIPSGAKELAIGHPIAVIVPKKDSINAFAEFVIEPTESISVEPPSAPVISEPVSEENQVTADDSSRIKASPYAKKLSFEKNVPLSDITGTGPKGRIIAKDVLASGAKITMPPAVEQPSSSTYTDIPISNTRRVIATRLTHSKQTIPHYYLTTEVYMDNVAKMRSSFNEQLKSDNVKLSFNDFIVKAASVCLKVYPESNSSWMDTFIRQHHNVDINVAVSTDNGLITPFVKDTNHKGLVQISNEVRHLAQKARDRTLKLDEFQGGTFTISNLGMYGLTSFAAVINPPQSAILAVGGIHKKFVPGENLEPVAKSVMCVTFCADHRTIDGAAGAQWLKKFKQLLEDPAQMLL